MNCLVSFLIMVFLAATALVNDVSASDYDWMKKDQPGVVAEKKLQNQYVLFRGGFYLPDKPSGMNTGTGVEAGYGIKPLRWFAAEVSAGYIETDDYDDNMNNMHRTIQMVPVMATVRAVLPFSNFDVYALAGGGMYYTMLKYDNLNQNSGSESDSKALFGHHYGGGASLSLGTASSVGVEVRQIVTKWDNLDISGTFLTAFFRLGL